MNRPDPAEFFTPGGTLSRLLDDYRPRPEQARLASAVADALDAGEHCLAEAGTGIGKSLAYLVPGTIWALEQGSRLLVSTQTKALQVQLLEHELPRLSASGACGGPFPYEICLGAENYLCLNRLLAEGQAEALPGLLPGTAEELRALMHWCLGPVSGVRLDAPDGVTDEVWRQVCAVKELCLGPSCPRRAECFLQLARERQRQAVVLVTNHSLFCSHLASGNRLLPEYGAAVLDEAHRFEDVATEFLGEEVRQAELLGLLGEVQPRTRHPALRRLRRDAPAVLADLSAAARSAAEEQTQWWDRLRRCFPPGVDTLRVPARGLADLPAPGTAALSGLAAELNALAAAAESEEEAKAGAYLASRLEDTAGTLERWQKRERTDHVYWTEAAAGPRGPRARVLITPLDISVRLRETLFAGGPSVVLTSATLAVNGDFGYLRARLGIAEAREVVLASPFPYREHTALYLPPGIPDPQETEAFEAVVLEEVEGLLRVFGGGLFVLFTNYRFLRRAAERLRARAPEATLLVQGEAPPARLLREFRRNGHAVMLGVETFWQGVDVPGDALRCVAITKLPFDVPTHPVHQARLEAVEATGGNAFLDYSVPRAVLMLRQGFGRLIRRHEDRGVVAILDPRVRTRPWGGRFLAALPECPRLSSADEVEDFVRRQFKLAGRGRDRTVATGKDSRSRR